MDTRSHHIQTLERVRSAQVRRSSADHRSPNIFFVLELNKRPTKNYPIRNANMRCKM